MALVKETGLVVAGANTYVLVAEADAYFLARNNTVWAALSTADKEAQLLYSASWIDQRYTWPGSIVDYDIQTMSWPRWGATDFESRIIEHTVVPSCIRDAQCEAALAGAAEALNEVRSRGGMTTSETVGPISVTYAPGAPPGRTWPYIDALVGRVAWPAASGVLMMVR